MKYLSDKIAKGEKISRSNAIFVKLNGKRGVKEVQNFLSTIVDPNLE